MDTYPGLKDMFLFFVSLKVELPKLSLFLRHNVVALSFEKKNNTKSGYMCPYLGEGLVAIRFMLMCWDCISTS